MIHLERFAVCAFLVSRVRCHYRIETEYVITVTALLLGLIAIPITFALVQVPDVDAALPNDFKEVAICFVSGKALLDLDTGTTIGPMARGNPSDRPQFDLFASWGVAKDGGRDATTVLSAQLAKLIRVDAKQWTTASVKSIAARLAKQQNAKRSEAQILAEQGDEEISTWIVQTRQAGVALVQVEYRDKIETEFSGDQNGFVVRYKTVPVKLDGDSTATRSITIRVFDDEGKALQGARVFRNHAYKVAGVDRPKIENKTYLTEMGGQVEVMLNGETVDLRLWVMVDGYTRLHAMWAKKLQSDGDKIPDVFTFNLSRATRIGGRITDEDGKPIEGVKVEVRDSGALELNSVDIGEPGKRPVRDIWITGNAGVQTDADGRWTVDSVPSDRELAGHAADRELPEDADIKEDITNPKIQLRIRHPDYHGDDTLINAEISDDTRWGEIQRTQAITLKSLRDKSATIKLKRR